MSERRQCNEEGKEILVTFFMALFSCENLFVFVNYYDSHILHIMPHSPPSSSFTLPFLLVKLYRKNNKKNFIHNFPFTRVLSFFPSSPRLLYDHDDDDNFDVRDLLS